MKVGFDNELYINKQIDKIISEKNKYHRLYLEVGGKLFDDKHAKRILPGFIEDTKIKVLDKLKDDLEIIICINARDIERKKIRADYGITYDIEVFRLIDEFNKLKFNINSVVITLYQGQKEVDNFINILNKRNIKTYIHQFTKGYPTDVNLIVSEEGYGANEFIKTTKSLVVVTAPGGASGKLATSLSQLYHEYKNNVKAGYLKYETFPVWDLPLKHPVNLAYGAAAADIKDILMIDPFHLEHYNKQAINYNRDIEVYPILKDILKKITGQDIYYSPTDMGVNMISKGITNDNIVKEASKQEIIRRYYQSLTDTKLGTSDEQTSNRIKMILNELEIDPIKERKVIKVALNKNEETSLPVIALELPNKKIITGKKTELLSPASSLIINAIKELTKIPDDVHLLSPSILEPILKNKQSCDTLNLNEVLLALSICSVTNPIIEKALSNLKKLKDCEAHSSFILLNGDLKCIKDLGINITCEPTFYSNNLYYTE